MELAVIVIRTWYVGSEVVLGVGLGPVDGGPGVAAAERGEQHVGLELPQRERVGRVEELAEQEGAEQGPIREHGPRRGIGAGDLQEPANVFLSTGTRALGPPGGGSTGTSSENPSRRGRGNGGGNPSRRGEWRCTGHQSRRRR